MNIKALQGAGHQGARGSVNIDLGALELEKPYSLPVPLTEAVFVLDAGKPKKVVSFR